MDASEKWCPWAQDSEPNDGSFNRLRGGAPALNCLCIKDRCIAWRKYYTKVIFDGQANHFFWDLSRTFYDCTRIRGPEGMVNE